MKPENLIYTYVSFASHINAAWGHGTPMEGVNRISNLIRKYGIPVTWIVNSGSISVFKEQFNKWHEQYGDDVILLCEPNPANLDKEGIMQMYRREWEVLTKAFPWVETKVGAAGVINENIIEALEETGFEGLWGYCWEQSWWDSITHKGIPWGLWYIDSDRWKAPHPGKGKMVACEWTARDLNLAYHTGSPCIYSTDPNDVLRAGLCTGEDITYWKKLFDDYLYNTENNEQVFFVQQQEAHEMEYTDAFAVYPFSHVEACTSMLDNFFKYISQYNITYTTLPKAIKMYHKNNQTTVPSYMLTNDSPKRPEINKYTMTLGGVGLGPWPETFLYYDAQCQMAFIKGENRPRMLRNYSGNSKQNDRFDEEVPMVIVEEKDEKSYIKTTNFIEIVFTILSHKAMPFGLTYWDDLAGFTAKACPNVIETKIIDEKLVFIRLNLIEGEQRIKLTLIRE